MNSNQPTQQVSIVDGEPAQLSPEFFSPESSSTHQNLNDGNGSTTIYIINVLPSTPDMSFVAPLSPSLPSSSESSMLTAFRTTSSPSHKSSHFPSTSPQHHQPSLTDRSISCTTNRKRKYSNVENSSPSCLKRLRKHEIDLDDKNTANFTEEQIKSIKKSKKCKEQRDRKASHAKQMESANVQLTEDLQVERSKSREKDSIISRLKAKVAKLENQNNGRTDEPPFELFVADYLKDIDFSEFET